MVNKVAGEGNDFSTLTICLFVLVFRFFFFFTESGLKISTRKLAN